MEKGKGWAGLGVLQQGEATTLCGINPHPWFQFRR